MFARKIISVLCFSVLAWNGFCQKVPQYYNVEHTPAYELIPTISMRFINGERVTVSQWDLKAGAKLPQHQHMHELITRVLSGDIDAYSGTDVYHLHKGDVMVFPGDVPKTSLSCLY